MQLLMPFKNDSTDFAEGFQCGQIWERLNHNDVIEGLLIHRAIVPQVEMMCKRFHCEYKIEPAYEGWSILDARVAPAMCN